MNATFLKMQVMCMSSVESLKTGAGRTGAAVRRLVKDERAVSVIEYAILLGVIVGAVTLAVTQFGNEINNAITGIAGRVGNTVSTVGGT